MIMELLALVGMVAIAWLFLFAALKTWDLFHRLGETERSIKQLNSAHSELWDRIRKVESSR